MVEREAREVEGRGCAFAWGLRTYVMGIVNVTPDSFSGDGRLEVEEAIRHGEELAAGGADILDVGGESTRPGAAPVTKAEELARVIPVIRGLRSRLTLPISVDTYRAEVAAAALAAGACMVNDVWGGLRDPDLPGVVARSGAWIVAMHNRTAPATVDAQVGSYFPEVDYDDLIEEVAAGLRHSIAILREAGVQPERIILDPGIGFGKSPEQNLEILARLAELRALGFPLLLGTSRKSVIGVTLSLPPEDRLEGTAATVALGIRHGADIVRVHDLPAMARVARMTDAIVRHPGFGAWPAPAPRTELAG
jgi:dihydropteroate synthase